MNTKLTLRLDENLIAQAKTYAAKEGRSLSELVGAYFARLAEAKSSDTEMASGTPPLSHVADQFGAVPSTKPRRSSFYGLIQNSELDEPDYRAHLAKKHL